MGCMSGITRRGCPVSGESVDSLGLRREADWRHGKPDRHVEVEAVLHCRSPPIGDVEYLSGGRYLRRERGVKVINRTAFGSMCPPMELGHAELREAHCGGDRRVPRPHGVMGSWSDVDLESGTAEVVGPWEPTAEASSSRPEEQGR